MHTSGTYVYIYNDACSARHIHIYQLLRFKELQRPSSLSTIHQQLANQAVHPLNHIPTSLPDSHASTPATSADCGSSHSLPIPWGSRDANLAKNHCQCAHLINDALPEFPTPSGHMLQQPQPQRLALPATPSYPLAANPCWSLTHRYPA